MWHGNTKGNVRNLFSEAISDCKKYGKDYKFERDLLYILLEHVLTILCFHPFSGDSSPLHIMFFDELDSIARVHISSTLDKRGRKKKKKPPKVSIILRNYLLSTQNKLYPTLNQNTIN